MISSKAARSAFWSVLWPFILFDKDVPDLFNDDTITAAQLAEFHQAVFDRLPPFLQRIVSALHDSNGMQAMPYGLDET